VKHRSAVVIRSGGLGDFVLTLPFLKRLSERYARVKLVTRFEYWDLIKNDGFADAFLDINGVTFSSIFSTPSNNLSALFSGADVFTFLADPDHILQTHSMRCGALKFTRLPSRPGSPPHITQQMFVQGGIDPGEGWFETPCLERKGQGNRLWIHPGSGSPRKNAPLGIFAGKAEAWHAETGGGITVSVGEADQALTKPARELLKDLPCRFEIMPTLPELRQKMELDAGLFMGNDSGVTHLAAALGIPVKVFFLSSSPEIWTPVGRDVTVIEL
jgi:heptosyltransferase-3